MFKFKFKFKFNKFYFVMQVQANKSQKLQKVHDWRIIGGN